MDGSGRNDAAIVEPLAGMAQVLAQANEQEMSGQQHQGGAEKLRFDHFIRNHPPMFKGQYDSEGQYLLCYGD